MINCRGVPSTKQYRIPKKLHNRVQLASCGKIPDSNIPCNQFYGEYKGKNGNVYNRKCQASRFFRRLFSGKCASSSSTSDDCRLMIPNQGTSDSTPGNVPTASAVSSKAVPTAALFPSTADHGMAPGLPSSAGPMIPNQGTSDSTPENVPTASAVSSKAVPTAALFPSTADHGTHYDSDIYMDVMQPTPASERKPTTASKRKHSPGGTFKDINMHDMQPTEPSKWKVRAS